MNIEKRLYTSREVGQIIKDAVHEIAEKLASHPFASGTEQETIMRQWANELLPMVDEAVVEEVVRRHVQGVTFSVWSGPPGSGKGTNIEAVDMLGKVYAEVASQGVARVLQEPYNSMLLKFSIDQSVIITGTKGMFNRPEGEYLDLFGELVPVVGKLVAAGGFAPDDLVSVLVELMILYRLTQNYHKVQLDLWPRTGAQFKAFKVLVGKISAAGGKISREIVAIKVLNKDSLRFVKNSPLLCAEESKKISGSIQEMLMTPWYQDALQKTALITEPRTRFAEEEVTLQKVLNMLKSTHNSDVGNVIVEELETVCSRMAFRFNLVVSLNFTPRPDEYPLSIVRRLAVFTGETSPTFLEEAANSSVESGFYIVSSAGTPEEVVSEILETLSGTSNGEERWQKIKVIAGEIAVALVNKKKLIVDELVKRVGGILASS